MQHFAFTSSVAVYRRTFVQPVLETFRSHDPHDTAPVKAYGVGKVQCEQYLDGLFQEHGFPYTVFRVSHTIGPRARSRHGSRSTSSASPAADPSSSRARASRS